MPIESLDHYSVRTAHVDRAVTFYERALGFCRGPRPAFNFPGAWLYRTADDGKIAGGSVVHIVGIDPDNSAGLSDYLGDKPASQSTGSGALDHIAFVACDILGLYAKLKQQGIAFRERKVPNMELHQVFIEDPDGVTIELNYARLEDISAGQLNMAALRT